MDIYNQILNMSYLTFHELWTIIWGDWNIVGWWAIITDQPSQSREFLLLTKWPESFSCYLLTQELINKLNVFCLVPEKMQKFNEVMESGTKSTHRFVIRFGISSLFTKLTKRRSPAADHMNWVLCHVICWRQHWSRNWTYFVSLQKGSSNLLR